MDLKTRFLPSSLASTYVSHVLHRGWFLNTMACVVSESRYVLSLGRVYQEVFVGHHYNSDFAFFVFERT